MRYFLVDVHEDTDDDSRMHEANLVIDVDPANPYRLTFVKSRYTAEGEWCGEAELKKAVAAASAKVFDATVATMYGVVDRVFGDPELRKLFALKGPFAMSDFQEALKKQLAAVNPIVVKLGAETLTGLEAGATDAKVFE